MNKSVISKDAPKPIGPYSQAVLANGTLYISGCLGVDPSSGELLDGIENQSKAAMNNLLALVKEANYTVNQIAKTTVFISDMNNFATFNAIYATYFDGNYFPARSCVEVSKLPKGGLVEIEAIACK